MARSRTSSSLASLRRCSSWR
ncbi:hypothetical protein LEMLEM_LOCUS5474 [Lemmus lemmus]